MTKAQNDNTGNEKMVLHKEYETVEGVRKQRQELNFERKEMLNLKKVIVSLAVFTLMLTLGVLGIARDTAHSKTTKGPQVKSMGEEVLMVNAVRGANVNLKPLPASEERTLPGRKHRSLTSLSPVGRGLKQEVLQWQRRRAAARRRRAIPCFKAHCGQYDGSDDDGDTGTFQGRVDVDDYELGFLDHYCSSSRSFDLEISDDEHDRIRDAFFDSPYETTVVLRFRETEGGDSVLYQHVMKIKEGYLVEVDGDEGMVFLVEPSLYCDEEGDLNRLDYDCWAYQGIFIFEPCSGSACTVHSCAYGGATEHLEDWQE